MKKLLCLILAAVMAFGVFAVYSGAATSYNAKFALTADIGGKTYTSADTIYIKPGSTVKVKLNLANDFYFAGVQAQVFYNSSIFTGASCEYNKNGKVYQGAGAQTCSFNDWANIAAGNREKWWPDYSSAKLKTFRENHRFCYLVMGTNPNFGEPAVKNINETVATFTFTVSSSVKDGTTGQIIIPAESVRSKNFKNGRTVCLGYTSSDMIKSDILNQDGIKYDMSKAVLNFKVGSESAVQKGDVNFDGKINSSDALIVLQASVGSASLDSKGKKAADVNGDGSINSSDALLILRYSVGEIKSL